MHLARARSVVLWLVLAVVVVLQPSEAVASGPVRASSRGSVARVTVVRVKIVDDAFRPRTITVSRGTRVRWRNRGTHIHSVRSKAGTWGSALLSPGDTYGHRFLKAGTFRYYCTVHPTMTGTVTVT